MNKNRREPPRPEDSKLGPDHYIAAWNGPIGVTLSWLAFVIAFLWLSFILTYSWMVRPERETIAMLAGTFLSLFGLYSFVLVSIGMFRNSIEVELRPTEVQGRSLYGRRKEVSFKDIRSITALRYGAKGVAIRTFSDPKLTMSISPGVICFGEMMEKIIAKSENIRELELKKLPESAKDWYKSPDWDIINAAKERAAANREAANAQRNH